jgi:hypothetical protein
MINFSLGFFKKIMSIHDIHHIYSNFAINSENIFNILHHAKNYNSVHLSDFSATFGQSWIKKGYDLIGGTNVGFGDALSFSADGKVLAIGTSRSIHRLLRVYTSPYISNL